MSGSLSPVRNPCFSERDGEIVHEEEEEEASSNHPSVFNEMVDDTSRHIISSHPSGSGWTSSSENEGDAMDEDNEGPFFFHFKLLSIFNLYGFSN